MSSDVEQAARAVKGLWVVNLLVGILFVILGFVVLSYETASLTVVSVLVGVSFLLQGLGWLAVGAVVREFRWVWILSGVIGIVAAIISFAYPDETLRVLSLLIGWFLLVAGVLDVVSSLANRAADLWWLTLVSGIVMFGLGAWAVREPDRSVILLLTIVGVYCLIRGVTELFWAFRLRGLGKELAT